MSTNSSSAWNPRFAEPRSAYLHVPFCRHRCGYCNFTLVAGREDLVPSYLSALDRELSELKTVREIDTLFLGGGTPSHLAPESLRQLIAIARRWFRLAEGYEFSIEANPLDITPERLATLQEGGVTRISLGIQSLQDTTLEALDRDHRRGDVERAMSLARAAIPALAVDLIFGAPGQTLASWQSDLERVLALRLDHVSVYGLTYERGTRFWSRMARGQIQRCLEDQERAMYEWAIDRLTAAGYEHYEVSNFARAGFRCRHNEAYWTGRTYYAAGPGAAKHVDGRREVNHRSTTNYLRRVLSGQSPVAESELLSPEESARERFVFGLRRLDGISQRAFARETGFEVASLFGEALDRFADQGFLDCSGGNIKLTRAGLIVSDALWPDLLHPTTP
jgi:oxygen-independent coproporphyrinogen-3 oxidase